MIWVLDTDILVYFINRKPGVERSGRKIGPNDLLIAAHARNIGATLVTNNEREFRRVPGLSVQNWLRP